MSQTETSAGHRTKARYFGVSHGLHVGKAAARYRANYFQNVSSQ
jgi:2-succinyl-5-enolpyruvyl-6-hydroxy-3-cyclohexene-1-carboxylate synthase